MTAGPMADAMTLRVDRIERQTPDILSFRLVDAGGEGLPAASAGAHVDILTPSGQVRQYSLCGDLADRAAYLIAVKHEPEGRGGSVSMHRGVRAGDMIRVGRPRNAFPLDDTDAPVVLLAGGVGVTPLLAMARRLATEGRAFALHYFVRGPNHVAFRSVLDRADLRAHVHLHQGCGPDETMRRLDTILGAVPAQGGVYLCGPPPFMAAARQLGQGRLTPGRLHAEDFASPAAPAPEDGERAFEVVLARSGLTVRVPPGVTIARALAEAGIAVEMSCEQGICGTCLTRVLAGRPDHRDQYLLDDEKATGDRMTLCVSRSLDARLVLDL